MSALIRRLIVLFGVALVFAAAMPASADAAPGDLDPSFGEGGSIRTSVRPQLLVPAAEGFVVAGVPLGDTEVVLERRHDDGTLVHLFGTGGKTVIPYPLGVRLVDVDVAADGSIFVATVSGGTWTVARVSAAGGVDQSFGDHGFGSAPLTTFNELAAMTVRPDGSVVLVGSVWRTDTSREPGLWAVAFDAAGRLDTGFGDGGVVVYKPGPPPATAADIVARDDGSLVIAGTIGRGSDPFAFKKRPILLGLTSGGSLDPAFGEDGVVRAREIPTSDPRAWALLERPDGRLVLFAFNDRFDTAFLEGYRANGRPDANTPARAILYLDQEAALAHPSFQPDGKIVVGVQTRSCVDGCEPPRSFLVRLRVDGRPNLTFNAPTVAQFGIASAVLASGRPLLGVYGPNTVFASTP